MELMEEMRLTPQEDELATAIVAVLAGAPLPAEMSKEDAIASLLMELEDVVPEVATIMARLVVLGDDGQKLR